MKVACIQIAAYDLAHAEAGLNRALEMIDEAARDGADLVVLPECSYPAYFLRGEREYAEAGLRPWDEIAALFGDKAREHRCHLVAGLVQPVVGQRLMNTAVLFDPHGNAIGSTAKSLLWHFDQRWFTPGTQYDVFETSIGKLGMLICADGRMPEIARVLALRDAQVIVDATAWVTGGSDRAALSNPQFEYMIPARALENGVWVVAANKVGIEADTVLYCGRSCVVDPNGKKVVVASPDREEVVVCDIDPSMAQGVPVRRRPDAYAAIAQPTAGQPVAHLLRERVAPDSAVVRMAAFQLADRPSIGAYLRRVEEMLDTVSRQDVRLVVLPGTMPGDADSGVAEAELALTRLAELSTRFGCGLAATLTEYDGTLRYRACFLWDAGKLVGKYRKVHQDDAGYRPGDELAVFETAFGRLGIMLDEEGLLPEVSRCLMLKGADTILWPAWASHWPLQMLARSRADENKVHVVLAAPFGGGTAILNPSGAVLAAALPHVEQAIAAQVNWAFARYKEMAPNTHVVWSRIPKAYKALTDYRSK
ncbi:MAG: carbon-nitrogen hydrolase family protein [Chloroflexi bacterium]|nr:carbon-nitrogen hydrolase family protein [Chloroflexota bacterium]